MASKWKAGILTVVLTLSPMSNAYAGPKNGRNWDDGGEGHKIRHVLLVSIDGMHALDLHNCTVASTCPNLAALASTGLTYTRTSTSKPSDSFPGLMAIVTGGTPKLVGAYYDVAYDNFVPARGERILVAGRCLSAEHEAMASARVTAQCFSYGQAIGMAAAMCLRNEEAPRTLNVSDLREALRKDGAVI